MEREGATASTLRPPPAPANTATEPRAECPHHQGEPLKLWCVRDEAPACAMCFLEGQHKGHDHERREAVEARQRAAELARVETAMGKIDAAVKLVEMIKADEQKSASEARAAKKRYLGRLFEVVMLREKALGDEIDEWERSRADKVRRRRAMLGCARRRLEEERTAIEQRSAVHGSIQSTVAEACQKANAMAAEVEAERLCTGRISFASSANIMTQGGTAPADLVGAILHAGHLHIYTNETKGKEEINNGQGELDTQPDRPTEEREDPQPDTHVLSRKRRSSTTDAAPLQRTEEEKDVASEEGPLRKSNRTRTRTERARESSAMQKIGASTHDEVPKDAVVQHGAALTLVGGDKLTQQITPLPNWASPPPKALKTAIITATGASTVKWESQGPLGPAITLKFEAVQPFMARGKSVKLYLGYKQARASGDPATTVLE